MPNVDINGTVVSFPDTMNPAQLRLAVSSAAGKLQKQAPMTMRGLAGNALRDAYGNIQGAAKMASYAFPPAAAARAITDFNQYSPRAVLQQGKELGQGLMNIPHQLAQEATHPIRSMYQKPITTFLDAATIADLGVEGAIQGGNLAKRLGKEFVPPTLKATRGIPLQASKMAIEDPSILKLEGSDASMQARTQDIINGIKEANLKTGRQLDEVYGKEGIPNPVEEIKNELMKYKAFRRSRTYSAPGDIVQKTKTENIPGRSYTTPVDVEKTVSIPGRSYSTSEGYPERTGINPTEITAYPKQKTVNIPGRSYTTLEPGEKTVNVPGRSYKYTVEEQGPAKTVKTEDINTIPTHEPGKNFDQLRQEYQDAKSGELFKKKNLMGGVTEMSDQEKLQRLTEIKRGLANEATYLPAGQQLSPTQGARNVAIKGMVKELGDLRDKIPGGAELGLADDAWHEMQEIRQRLWSQFKDPFQGRDYVNRILKGNTDWLTSGKNAGRVGAIERVEQITGKQLLKPALREVAAAYLKNPDIMSLPSFSLKSILGKAVPTKAMIKSVSGEIARPSFLNKTTPILSSAAALRKRREKNEDSNNQ